MSQESYAASAQAVVIARVLAAPAIALGLLLIVVLAVQPASANDSFAPDVAVAKTTVTGQLAHVVPVGFKKHGHVKGPIYKKHRAFKKRPFFKHGHGFKKHSFYGGHRGFKRHGFGKHRFGFRKGFVRGHRGFRGSFFRGHRRFH